MTRWDVWRDSFLTVFCDYHVWLDALYVWRVSFICEQCLVHMRDMPQLYVWYMNVIQWYLCHMACVSWLIFWLFIFIFVRDTVWLGALYVWLVSLICQKRLVNMCDMPQLYVWHTNDIQLYVKHMAIVCHFIWQLYVICGHMAIVCYLRLLRHCMSFAAANIWQLYDISYGNRMSFADI